MRCGAPAALAAWPWAEFVVIPDTTVEDQYALSQSLYFSQKI